MQHNNTISGLKIVGATSGRARMKKREISLIFVIVSSMHNVLDKKQINACAEKMSGKS